MNPYYVAVKSNNMDVVKVLTEYNRELISVLFGFTQCLLRYNNWEPKSLFNIIADIFCIACEKGLIDVVKYFCGFDIQHYGSIDIVSYSFILNLLTKRLSTGTLKLLKLFFTPINLIVKLFLKYW